MRRSDVPYNLHFVYGNDRIGQYSKYLIESITGRGEWAHKHPFALDKDDPNDKSPQEPILYWWNPALNKWERTHD